MELRSSSRRRNEYKELQITLNGMGFYEEGMELQEMRQILDALQMSVNEGETNFLECDMQKALRESEMDFLPNQDGRVLNSTMRSIHPHISPCSSPEIPPERIVVQAEVHHPMDWSPHDERLQRKRNATPLKVGPNENIPHELDLINELLEPAAKRFHETNASLEVVPENDLSLNMVVENSNVANEDIDNNSFEDNSHISTSSAHEIHGPITVRRIHDSGLNMSDIPSSSFEASASANSNASASNLSHAGADLVQSLHERQGPVSVRRIHDSGVNITTEMPQFSFNESVESSNYASDNSNQVSNSSAVNPYYFDYDSEPSI